MLGIVNTCKEADSRIFRTKLKPLVVAMLPVFTFGNIHYAHAGSCAAGAVTIAPGSGGCTIDGVNPVTTVEFLSGVTNSDTLALTGGNAPSGAVTTQTDGRGMVTVLSSTTSQNSFGVAGTGDLNVVNVNNNSTFNLGHDLATNYLNVTGRINQTAGTVTINTNMDLTAAHTIYNQSGTGVLNGTRLILGSTSTLILQNQGTGRIEGSIDGRGALIFAGNYDTDSVLGFNASGSSRSLASITVNDGVTLTLDENAKATNVNVGQGNSGILNQSAATLTATNLNLNNGATYNLSGTGVVNATNISIGSGASLNVNQVGNTSIASTISGSGAITQNGSGTLTLSGSNTYSGGTTINDGTLSISSDSNLGDPSGDIVFNGGTLQATSDLTLNSGRSITLNSGGGTIDTGANNVIYNGRFELADGGLIKKGSGTLTHTEYANYSGNTVIEDGTLKILNFSKGSYINNGALIVDAHSGNRNMIHGISGTGSFTKEGAGSVGLWGDKTYTGNTYINNGILYANGNYALGSNGAVTVNSTGRLVLAGNLTVGSLAGAGNVDLSYSGANTLTTGGNNTSTTFSGVLSGGGGSLVKTGTGTLTLSGLNTYSGGTTVNGGSLQGTTDSLQGDIVNNANVAFDQSASGTYAGAMSGIGGLVKSNTGVLTLTGTNTYSGGTTVNGGTLQGTTDSLQGDIVNNANVAFDQSASGTYTGVISGTGGLVKSNTGVVTLTGTNTYSGGTIVSGGTLQGTTDSLQGDIVNNAKVAFDQSASGTYAGAMGGTGHLIKSNTGVVTLTGTNTYSGGTTVSGGTLQGTTDSLQGDIVNNANVAFDQSASGTYAGAMGGTGHLIKSNTGVLTLTGTNTYSGGTTVNGGTLQGTTDSLQGDIVNNANVAFDQSASGIYAGAISGTGSLVKSNAGRLNLTGLNTYSGDTTINDGILSVNGSAANSRAIVNTSGTLGGSGTIGGISLNGGTLAPGNSIGTLNVAGDVDFSAGGVYAVEVDAAGNSDYINATGTATLTNGSVQVIPEAGTYNLSTDYTILTAAGGLGGTTFDSVSSTLAFLTPTLTYDANNVLLNLRRNTSDYASVSTTPNQVAVGTMLDQLFNTGTTSVDTVLSNLNNLTAAGARQAYDALSGVQHTYSNQVSLQSVNQFKGLLFDRINTPSPLLAAKESDRMLAYNDGETMTDAGSQLFDSNPPAEKEWWIRGVANYGNIDDTLNVSGADYNASGVAIGADYKLDDKLTLGAAFGQTRTDVDVDLGSMNVSTYQAALYGKKRLEDDYYVSGMAGIGYHNTEADRQVIVGLTNSIAKSDYNSWTGNMAIEGGRRFAINETGSVTPYAGIEYAHLYHEGFTERGAGEANLKVADNTQNSLRSAIGARIEQTWTTNKGYRVRPSVELAWVHEYLDDTAVLRAGFAPAPETTFSLDGSKLDRDRARVGLGLNMQLSDTASLTLGYQGEIAGSDERQDFSATYRMAW